MFELMSPWKEHLIDFYEHKIHCGYKYEKGLIVISLFDRYYSSLNIDDLVFSRDIVEPFLYLDSKGRWGGVLDYVLTPLGRKSGKRERRKSSVSHVASSTEW